MLTQARLKELVHYKDGHLYWKDYRANNKIKPGDRLGRIKDGYIQCCIDGRRYYEQNLVWLYHKGVWPTTILDHRDTNRSNNEIDNLREATRQQNAFNRSGCKKSTSKYKGVSWNTKEGKWVAQACINYKKYFLGYHSTEESAAKAYNGFVKDKHKDFMFEGH